MAASTQAFAHSAPQIKFKEQQLIDFWKFNCCCSSTRQIQERHDQASKQRLIREKKKNAVCEISSSFRQHQKKSLLRL
jgi:hypothetical protein